MIDKAKRPRYFKSVNPENLPVLWYVNCKAWMTAVIFSEQIGIINKNMKQKK